jgi:hypothetical protein
MANFVRKILQGEENKGVELTGGGGNVGEPGDEGGRLTVDSPDKVGIFDLKLKVNQERSCRQSSFLQGESGDGRKCLTQSSRRAQRTRSGKQRRKLIQSVHGTGHSFHFSSFALPPGAADFGSIPSNSPAILPLATPAAPRGSPPLQTSSQHRDG